MKLKEIKLNETDYSPAKVKELATNALSQLKKIGEEGKLPSVYKDNVMDFLGDWFQDLPWTTEGTITSLQMILKDKSFAQINDNWIKNFKHDLKKDLATELKQTQKELHG